VTQAVAKNGLQMSASALFLANLAYNVGLAGVIFLVFGGLALRKHARPAPEPAEPDVTSSAVQADRRLRRDQIWTLVTLTAVAVAAFRFGLNIGFVAMAAATILQLLFPASSAGAEKKIAWSVVLLVCGIVTYVAALQRYGTMAARR
jgi:Na+/H+ antiporter NhaD/arsenite permease-like protein